MEVGFTEEQEQFREEVRLFLKSEMEAGEFTGRSSEIWHYSHGLSKKFAERGWIGMTWPKEHGGQGRTYVDRAILMEECLKFQAPIGIHFMGDRQVGPAIIHFGSDWQKAEFLPRILNGEAPFCLLFSEPDAGSDLVSVRTTAIADGDRYIVNGQKVWNSYAHEADYGWLLARTDPDAPEKHKGCSEFILDMHSPGVTVRPLINIVGVHSFNEVFLEDVRVPKEYLVGQVNRGFYQIMEQMDYERAGLERLMQNYPLYKMLLQYVKETLRNGVPLAEDPLVRDEIAQLEIDFEAGRLFCYYIAWLLDQGRIPNYEAALCKAYCTHFEQGLTEVATRIMGPYGQLMPGSRHAPCKGEAPEIYLLGRSFTIQGGTQEILKNIVSRRGLKLPTLR
jgi:alkylation response protein AidB-like acyl-CoA dehydrogenase